MGVDLERQLDERRTREQLDASVEALPAGQRHALCLQLAGHSYREIADELGIEEKSASARISRARSRLKQRFGTS